MIYAVPIYLSNTLCTLASFFRSMCIKASCLAVVGFFLSSMSECVSVFVVRARRGSLRPPALINQ